MLASIPSPSFNGLHLGPVEIRIYGLAYVVAVIAAIAITTRRWERQGGSRELVHEVALWGFPAGLIGGRLYFLATSWNEVPDHWWGPLAIWKGGLGIWGGIALGTLGGLVVLRRRGADIARFMDAAAPGLLVAQAIGRIGNYFNQELFGGPASLPWALEIDPAHRPAGYEAYSTFHPTFLYELTFNLALAGALIWLGRRRQIRAPGLFALYVAGYSGFRIFEELLRTDPAHHILGLRLNFFVATLLCLAGLAWFVRTQRAGSARRGLSRDGPAALGLGWLIVALSGCGHGSHAEAAQAAASSWAPVGRAGAAVVRVTASSRPAAAATLLPDGRSRGEGRGCAAASEALSAPRRVDDKTTARSAQADRRRHPGCVWCEMLALNGAALVDIRAARGRWRLRCRGRAGARVRRRGASAASRRWGSPNPPSSSPPPSSASSPLADAMMGPCCSSLTM